MEMVKVNVDNPCALLKCGQCRLRKCACNHARGVGICKDFIFPARGHGDYTEDRSAGIYKIEGRGIKRAFYSSCDWRQKTIFAMCSRKHRYANEHEAHKAIKRIVAEGGKELREYECYFCHGWHLTSQTHEQTVA